MNLPAIFTETMCLSKAKKGPSVSILLLLDRLGLFTFFGLCLFVCLVFVLVLFALVCFGWFGFGIFCGGGTFVGFLFVLVFFVWGLGLVFVVLFCWVFLLLPFV